jgi:FkbM family methyltransferase
MARELDCKLKDGTTVMNSVMEPIRDKSIELKVVDVGARNGMQEGVIPRSYSKESTIIGFEPNPDEYNKLVTQTTDAEKVGAPMMRFKNEKYFNCALWSNDEKRPFYITAGEGACTLMGEPDKKMCRNMWFEGSNKSYFDEHTNVLKTIEMDCKRLDSLLPETDIIDILKLDIEGAELAVLEGSKKILDKNNILFIKSEFFTTPYFSEGPLLGHQHVYLHDCGFRLIDLDIDHSSYSREKTSYPSSADRRPIYAGDAYFMLDPERNNLSPIKLHRMGIVCLNFHFSSLGVSLLREAGLMSEKEIIAIEKTLASNWTTRRAYNIWGRIPAKIKDLVR